MAGTIFDIQRFAVHDGPGIRSTVFFKGCSCSCAWCHNPESLSVRPQIEFYPSRCIGCGKCFAICPVGAHRMAHGEHMLDRDACTGCGKCAESCYSDALVQKGRDREVADVLRDVLADRAYYAQSGGGVTLSGGEPVLQSAFAAELLARLKAEGIHTALQTAGNYPFERLEPLLPHLDLVMYDIKGFAPSIYKWHIHGDRDRILGNLTRLDTRFGGSIAVRTPVVGTVNDTREEIEAIAGFISGLAHLRYYQLMPYHALAKAKYDALGAEFTDAYATPSAQRMEMLETVAMAYVPVYNQEKGIRGPKETGKDEKYDRV